MTVIRIRVAYKNLDFKKESSPGINITWIQDNEAILEGDDIAINDFIKTLQSNGGIIEILENLIIIPVVEPPKPTQGEIDESLLQRQTLSNVNQAEIDRINNLLEAEYTKLGGVGSPPFITSLRDLR